MPLLSKTEQSLSWNVILDKVNGNVITVQVTTSPDAIVGKWNLEVDTRLIQDGAYSYSWETGKSEFLMLQVFDSLLYFIFSD